MRANLDTLVALLTTLPTQARLVEQYPDAASRPEWVKEVLSTPSGKPGYRQMRRELRFLPEDLVKIADATLEMEPSPEDLALAEERAVLLHRAVAALPQRQRQVVECRFLRELSIKETAKELGVSTEWVKEAQALALKKLRATLTEENEE